jgi:hypothetical protein
MTECSGREKFGMPLRGYPGASGDQKLHDTGLLRDLLLRYNTYAGWVTCRAAGKLCRGGMECGVCSFKVEWTWIGDEMRCYLQVSMY